MRRTATRWMALAVAVLAGSLAPPAAAAPPLQPVDPHYQDEVVLDGLESPMAVRFAPAPDGRIFVAEKSGKVLAFDDKRDKEPVTVVDLSDEVHDFWDRGLLGMALDPAFTVNGRLFLLYARDAAIGGTAPRWGDTCPDPPGAMAQGCVVSGALVRVTVDALGVGTVDKTLIEDEWCQQYPSHSVGSVGFGPDGMLYVSGGEGASFSQHDWGQLPGTDDYPSNPCGDPVDDGGAMRAQDVRTAGDPTGLSGAIIRIDPNTAAGAPGNPFADGDAGARRLIAYGLRNPFRWAFRPGTDEIWTGDVGSQVWEEINVVADANDGVAENFGWPCFEGAGPRGGPWDGVPGCQTLPESAVTGPRLAYEHGKELVAGDGCRWNQGSSVSGMAFPSGYDDVAPGSLYFADYSSVCIFAMAAGAGGVPDPSKVTLFARGATGTGGPVELQEGPEGDLYYTYYDPVQPSGGSVHRIRHMPSNRAPEVEIAADPTSGPAPLAVTFSAAGSSDPDGDDLSYAWDLDGDGDFDDATGVTAHRTYAEPGSVEAGVLVSDPFGESAEAHVTVTAGNTPPRPVIDAPANGASWSVGEPIAFHGSAEDDQETLDPGALVWRLTLDHCPQVSGCHTHPIEHVTGTSGTISGPEHDYPSRVVLTLVATDSGGLTGSASVKLEPRPAHVRVKTDTAGTEVSLDGIEGADVQRTVIAGTRVVVAAAAQQAAGDVLWKFEGWDDGVFTATRALLPKADVTLTARFTRAATPTPTPAAEDAAPEPSPSPTPAAQEPGPVAPVAERTPPRITVPRQSARRLAAVLPLDASCRPECRLSARATLRAAGAEHRLPRPRSRARGAGRRFELRLPAKARAAARNALKRQRAARLEIVITARDSAGARGTVRVRMPLRLR